MDRLCLLCKRIVKEDKIISFLQNISFFYLICFFFLLATEVKADQIDVVIRAASQHYGVSEEIIYNVITVESGFDINAVSHCDARGLMQITRSTWEWICQDYLKVNWDFDQCAFDPEKNIEVGTCFLKWIKQYLNSHDQDLNDSKDNLLYACYNAGPGAVKNCGFRVPAYKETRNYLKKIKNLPSKI